jgi:hypothetical protein
MNISKIVEIELKDGRVVTLEMSEKLVQNIQEAFNLPSQDDITDRHIKYYLISSMKNALEDQR